MNLGDAGLFLTSRRNAAGQLVAVARAAIVEAAGDVFLSLRLNRPISGQADEIVFCDRRQFLNLSGLAEKSGLTTSGLGARTPSPAAGRIRTRPAAQLSP